MITLYDYQQKGTNEIRALFAQGIKKVLYQLSTGGGKTVVFSYIAKESSQKNKRILIISHRIELLSQSGGTLQQFGLNPVLITADVKTPPTNHLYVAMVNTLKNRLKHDVWKAWFSSLDMIIIDECHRADFSWITFDKFKLGVTASPRRTGKMPQLSLEYERMVCGPDTQELINMGRLMPDRYFGVEIDLKGVPLDNKGEFDNSALFQRYNKTELYMGVIDNWRRICENTITIVFCCNIQHCIETARAFNEAGVKAKFLTSDVVKPKEGEGLGAKAVYERKMQEYENYQQAVKIYSGDRTEVLAQWKRREFHVLINAGLFVEGFDHKPIETVIVNLATTSVNKWLQMLGRGSRPSPATGKKFFYILDFGLNADRLGHYRAQREWSLHHAVSKSEGIPSSKTCPCCQALVIASAKYCKYCGFEFPKTQEQKVAELVEYKYANAKPKEVDFKTMSFSVLEEYAKQRGYSKSFVYRTVYYSQGERALKEYGKSKGYAPNWAYAQMRIFNANKKVKN